ncbi:DUF2239 family protein [Isosphaeraceae bacterium EP7]
MDGGERSGYTAFEGARRIASGDRAEVALLTRDVVERGASGAVLIFDDSTGEQVDWDLRGTAEEVRERLLPPTPDDGPVAERPEEPGPTRGPGRPKLGVVAREVTLLPRHWEWLNGQPGGASVALRKLVEVARRENESRDRTRRATEAAYRFMSAMAGDRPGFEEASRALFAGDARRFEEQIKAWPDDLRQHLRSMADVFMNFGEASPDQD